MRLKLTPEQELIKRTVADFVDNEIIPHASELEEADRFPRDVIAKCSDVMLMGMTIPQEYGGTGMDRISYCLALEELARGNAGIGLTIEAHNSLGMAHIFENGSEEFGGDAVPGSWIVADSHGFDRILCEGCATRRRTSVIVGDGPLSVASDRCLRRLPSAASYDQSGQNGWRGSRRDQTTWVFRSRAPGRLFNGRRKR